MIYVGSKARLAKYIVPILQDLIDKGNFESYFEPFVGGANIIDKIKHPNKIGCDNHEGLISIYQAVKGGWVPPLTITEEDYKDAKAGKVDEPLRSYIGFNGSYCSKYFGGFARCFKADGVTPRDRYNEKTRTFIEQIPHLLDTKFLCGDFNDLVISDSLIYCDPPYKGTQQYGSIFPTTVFWEWVRRHSERGNTVIVSEFSAPKDFKSIWSKERAASLDKDTGGKKSIEHLFVYSR